MDIIVKLKAKRFMLETELTKVDTAIDLLENLDMAESSTFAPAKVRKTYTHTPAYYASRPHLFRKKPFNKKHSRSMKKVWASYTPAERRARINKGLAARGIL